MFCIEIEHGLLRLGLVSEPVYWTKLDRKATLIFGERPGAISVIIWQTWRCLLLCGGPAALILDLMQVLAVSKRNDLLFKAESIDQ